jgi:hypothetical protein
MYKGLTFKQAVKRERKLHWALRFACYVLGVVSGYAAAHL